MTHAGRTLGRGNGIGAHSDSTYDLVMTEANPGRRLLIGTCNWADHGGFYPPELEKGAHQKEKLAWYARYFPIVEVDSSFYGVPKPSITARWAEETPPAFVFNVKAFRTLTGHGLPGERRATPTKQEEHDFSEALKPLRESGKLGAVHYQFPPWAIFDKVQNREAVVAAVERHPDDLVAVEFRHRSWYDGDNHAYAEELLRELGAVWVSVDAPQNGRGTAPRVPTVTSPRLAIVRFHGRNEQMWYKRTGSSRDRFDYYYSRSDLEEWKSAIGAMAERADTVHLLMNTNNRNQGPANAYRLADVLQIGLPAPPDRLRADAHC